MSTKTIPRLNTDVGNDGGAVSSRRGLVAGPSSGRSCSLSHGTFVEAEECEVAEELFSREAESTRRKLLRSRSIRSNFKERVGRFASSRSQSVPRGGYVNRCGHAAVLVVDDQAFNRLVMTDLLNRRFGLSVDVVRIEQLR